MDYEYIIARTRIFEALQQYLDERQVIRSVDEKLVIPVCNYLDPRAYFKGYHNHELKIGEKATDRPCLITIDAEGRVDLKAFLEDYRHEYECFTKIIFDAVPENDGGFSSKQSSEFWSAPWRETINES